MISSLFSRASQAVLDGVTATASAVGGAVSTTAGAVASAGRAKFEQLSSAANSAMSAAYNAASQGLTSFSSKAVSVLSAAGSRLSEGAEKAATAFKLVCDWNNPQQAAETSVLKTIEDFNLVEALGPSNNPDETTQKDRFFHHLNSRHQNDTSIRKKIIRAVASILTTPETKKERVENAQKTITRIQESMTEERIGKGVSAALQAAQKMIQPMADLVQKPSGPDLKRDLLAHFGVQTVENVDTVFEKEKDKARNKIYRNLSFLIIKTGTSRLEQFLYKMFFWVAQIFNIHFDAMDFVNELLLEKIEKHPLIQGRLSEEGKWLLLKFVEEVTNRLVEELGDPKKIDSDWENLIEASRPHIPLFIDAKLSETSTATRALVKGALSVMANPSDKLLEIHPSRIVPKTIWGIQEACRNALSSLQRHQEQIQSLEERFQRRSQRWKSRHTP